MAERNSFARQIRLAVAAALLPLLAACASPAPELRAAVEVKLLAFNDFHGYLTPPFSGVLQPGSDPAGVSTLVPAGGIEHLSTLVTTLRAKNPRTVLVSAGDLVGASPLISSFFDDEPTVQSMNRIGLDFIDEADAVNRLVPELRAQGVETVVVLLHQGGAQRGGDYNSCEEFSGPVVDIAFMNPGGVRAPLPYKEGGGITYGELFAVHPFGNTLVTMTLTGEQIVQILEQQWQRERPRPLHVSKGFSYEWNGKTQPGQRVVPGSVTLNGKPLDRAASYRITVNNFLADGGDGFPAFVQGEQRVVGITDIEAMIDYRRTHSPISRDSGARVRRVE